MVLFPLPDSPTIPNVSPFFSVKLTSFTALKGFFPLWVNIFVKCSASKSMLIL